MRRSLPADGSSPRSWLFVPGDRPDRVAKALGRGADAVVVDLEDAVDPARKAQARAATQRVLAALPDAGSRPPLWVRVNRRADDLAADLAAVLSGPIDGLVLPKITSSPDVAAIVAVVAGVGVVPPLIGMIETAAAAQRLPELAETGTLSMLMLGEQDLSADLGFLLDFDDAMLDPLRLQAVLACAAAGLPGPIGSPQIAVQDLDRLAGSSRALAAVGFSGRAVIHPDQIVAVNTAFSPSHADVERARRVVAEFDAHAIGGTGVLVDAGGRMIDEAVVRRARSTLTRAAADIAGP